MMIKDRDRRLMAAVLIGVMLILAPTLGLLLAAVYLMWEFFYPVFRWIIWIQFLCGIIFLVIFALSVGQPGV